MIHNGKRQLNDHHIKQKMQWQKSQNIIKKHNFYFHHAISFSPGRLRHIIRVTLVCPWLNCLKSSISMTSGELVHKLNRWAQAWTVKWIHYCIQYIHIICLYYTAAQSELLNFRPMKECDFKFWEDYIPGQYTAQPRDSGGQIVPHSCCILNSASSEGVYKAYKYHSIWS